MASFSEFGNWWDVADEKEQERVEKLLNPSPNSISLSEMFPCSQCKAITPHFYCRGPSASEESNLVPGKIIGRTTECVICKTVWVHHVGFKGFPRNENEMSRLYSDKK